MIIVKQATFDSAHQLKWHKGKCKNLHGHTYKLEVGVKGKINENGIVIDFGDLKKIIEEKVIEKYDHKLLNDYFENPTAENIAVQILKDLKSDGVALVRLWETPTCYVEVTHEDL